MYHYSHITTTGNLGADATIQETNGGRAFMSFSIAHSRTVRGEDKTAWYRCVMFRPQETLEKLAPYLTKGAKILVGGQHDAFPFVNREGEERYGNAIMVDSIDFMQGRREEAEGGSTASTSESQDEDEDITW